MRFDFQIVESWIDEGSRILDLGCGDGELLYQLKKSRSVNGMGVEQSEEKVALCVNKGITVIQGDIREEILDFPDRSFDVVILSHTLQQVYNPVDLIRQILKKGKKAVVSFPNFAHWRVRLQLLMKGHAPKTDQLPYEWHNTPNIRVLSLRDFHIFARQAGFSIRKQAAINLSIDNSAGYVNRFLPNLTATYGLFLISEPSA